MNKGQMNFFGNCCSVYVYVWMCVSCYFDNGVDLLDFYFSTFRGPAQENHSLWGAVFCSSLIETVERNKSHTFFFSFSGFKLVLNVIEQAGDSLVDGWGEDKP